jgi:hypothetical protein
LLISDDNSDKWCPECGEHKPRSEFFTDRRAHDGKTSYCKPCMTRRNAESKARRARGERLVQRRARRALLDWSDEKKCCSCGEVKPLEAFAINRTQRRGVGSYCLPCHNRIVRDNAVKVHGSTRDKHLKQRYGLTSEDVAAMVAAQGGVCAICEVRPAEHVDHDHDTGAVRGILCFTCNVGLGNFNDEPERLLLAYYYLNRTPGVDSAARVRRILRRAS